MYFQKYYTEDGKERPPTLHEIICCEANIIDCKEAERIEKLIEEYYTLPSEWEINRLLYSYGFMTENHCEILAQAIYNLIKKGE